MSDDGERPIPAGEQASDCVGIARDAFLVRLDDATRPLIEAHEITQTAARLLGEHLGVNRCAYAGVESDEDTFNLLGDYNRDVPSIVGRYRFAEFGSECLRLMRAGDPYVVDDVESDPRTIEVREAYRQTRISAVICVSLRKGERFVGSMAVHQATPRRWTAQEIELVQLVANRCWESIERARAQEDLRRQWHTFDVALAHTPDFTYIFDLQGRFTYVNASLLALWQKSLDEAVGRDFFQLGYPPVLAQRLQDQIRQVIDTKAPVRDQTPFTGPTGETRNYEYIFVPVLGNDGRLQAVAGSTRDVTDRIKTEEELRQANDRLIRTNRELEQYAYIVSHDLQEPLRMVSQYVGLIDRRARDCLDESARGFMDQALDGVQRMHTMIRDLLALARLDRGSPQAAVDLNAVFDVAVRNLKSRIAEAGATITHEHLPRVIGNQTQLVQLLQNLIGNAIKYRSRERVPVIHAWATPRDVGWWAIGVRDNGIGIPIDQQQRIFDVFQRLHGRTEYEGTGIGLAICKKIVESHGGTITVEPQVGVGATFVFTLRDAEEVV